MIGPKRIGKYEILEEIGRGGFAVVYRACDTELDREVALKVLHPYWTNDPGFAARFRREARAAARLRHPHIVTLYEAGEAEGQLYIAMEYLPGRTLRALVEAEGALPLERALPILEQVAEALDYAHGQGVVHRDVKPGNVIVEETERGVQATLTDFGLAKAMEGSAALTSQGTLLGSPEYMAPEQADPERTAEVGPAADRYALGIVAYQMLTGRVPFPGNTPATLNAHEHKLVPRPRSLRSELPRAVEVALLKMLAKAPADRFPSACAFVAQLREAMLKRAVRHSPVLAWSCVVAGLSILMVLVYVGVTLGPILWRALFPGVPAAKPPATISPTPSPTNIPINTPTRESPPTSASLDDTWLRPGDEMVMLYVPAGEFEMGSNASDSNADDDEFPQHTVALDGFWLDQTEVTNAQFAAFLNEQGNQTEEKVTWLELESDDCLIEKVGGEHQPESGYADHPVIEISWYGAAAYCKWVGARLPKEAEWEYAARGPQGFIYPWGDNFDCSRGNFDDETQLNDYVVPGGQGCDGYVRTAPVGSFPAGASWCKALHMSGNVWEWVVDWYGDYPSAAQTNPTGPEEGSNKVMRGGGWCNSQRHLRAADRYPYAPSGRGLNVGFRCVIRPGD